MADNYFGITDTGRQRDNNEDTFFTEKVLNNRYIAACVIDGVGGYEGGEVAAAIARNTILDYFKVPSGQITTMMLEAFMAANVKIQQEKEAGRQNRSMACVVTMAMADVENNIFYYAHVGDTRLYLLRDNSLVKVSKDHSFVGFLEDSGRLTEDAAMSHPKRNEINKALGFATEVEIKKDYIEVGESPFLPGDLLLLCSDGLTDMVTAADMTTVLTSNKTLAEKATTLVKAANEAGGKDNITVVLVHNNKKPLQQKATKPAAVKKKPEPQSTAPRQQSNVTNTATAQSTAPLEKQEAKTIPEAAPKKGMLVPVLSFLCLLFLGLFVWMFLRQRGGNNANAIADAAALQPRNEVEAKLQDTINRMGTDTLLLHQLFQNPIVLTGKLLIQKDSLYLKGNGQTLITKDSLYKGAALVLAPNCRYVVLDSITLQNFDIGILAHNNIVHLKNVRFDGCAVPVQYLFQFPNNQYVTGAVRTTSFASKDSLPQ